MKIKKLKLFLVLLLLFMAAIIVLMNITITSPRIRDMAISQLEKVLGRPVRIGELKINLWRGIEIRDLSFENHKNFQPGDFVRVKALVIRYKLLPLLRKRLVIGKISLVDPWILLERNGEGDWNFSELLALRGRTPISREQPSAKRVSLLISRITLTGGKIDFRDGKISRQPTETKVENLDFALSGFSLASPFQFHLTGTLKDKEPTDFALKGKLNLLRLSKSEVNFVMDNLSLSSYEPYLQEYVFPVELKGKSNLNLTLQVDKDENLHLISRIEGEDIGIEFPTRRATGEDPLERIDNVDFSLALKLTTRVAYPLKIIEGEGTLNIAEGEVKLSQIESPLNNIKGRFKMEGRKVSFSELKANLGKGTIELQGEVNNLGEDFLDLSRMAYSFQIDFNDLNLNDFLSSTNLRDMISGKLRGQASFQGKQLSPEAISGQGELWVKEGKLKGMPLMQLLVSLLGMPSLAEIDFQEIYTDFSLANKLVRTDNFRLLSRDVDMFAEGTFDFDTNLDYELVIRLSPEMSAEFPLQRIYPQDEEGRTLIKTPLTGPFKKPEIDLLKAPAEQIIKKGLEDLLKIFGE